MRLMMNRNHLSPARLSSRTVLSVQGADRLSFLQGLVTADLTPLSAPSTSRCCWSALLTPQGRIEALFFVFNTPDALLIDVPSTTAEELQKRLTRFRLRADVQLSKTDLHLLVGTPTSPKPTQSFTLASDPRTPQAGWRALLTPEQLENEKPHLTPEAENLWNTHRLHLGLPEWEDIIAGRTLALEADLDHLNGVSWSKGCYMGQEVTARTHYRGLLKRRLMPVELSEGMFPTEETVPLLLNGTEVGELRSRSGSYAIALLRREAWGADTLQLADGRTVRSLWPNWLPHNTEDNSKAPQP